MNSQDDRGIRSCSRAVRGRRSDARNRPRRRPPRKRSAAAKAPSPPVTATGKRTAAASISEPLRRRSAIHLDPHRKDELHGEPRTPAVPLHDRPYYRSQITSVLSILHRATGVVPGRSARFGLAWWLLAAAAGGEAVRHCHCVPGVAARQASCCSASRWRWSTTSSMACATCSGTSAGASTFPTSIVRLDGRGA